MKNTCNKLKKYDCYELVNNCFKKNIQNVLSMFIFVTYRNISA